MKNGDYILVKAPDNYPGKKYRGKYCYEHILVFWKTNGVFPNQDEIIHHKDGNKHNNAPENLEIMKTIDHTTMHLNERTTHYVELVCPGCQRHFVVERRQSYLVKKKYKATCCSRQCRGKYTRLPEAEKEIRRSKMLVREFNL